MKLLFICPYPTGKAPSQRFRFEHYFKTLENYGIDYEVHSFFNHKVWETLYSKSYLITLRGILIGFISCITLLFRLKKYQFVFIHREASPVGPPIFEWLIVKVFNKKMIYDFDDAIWLEDPDEAGTLLAKLKWKKKVKSICRWSYKISVGNEYLASFAHEYNNNVTIIPTVVDTEGYHNPNLHIQSKQAKNVKPVIGWTGTHSTLGYLNKVIPTLEKIYKEKPFTLLVISNQPPSFSFPDLKFIKWSKETEIEDLLKMDIGIMPLTDDLWSKGKCGFKIIQYMALELPTVASEVGVNQKIIDHSINGFLVNTEEEWKHYLLELLSNQALGNRIEKKGREKIIKYYSVKSTETDFLKLFDVPLQG